jgi:hypothetical protein
LFGTGITPLPASPRAALPPPQSKTSAASERVRFVLPKVEGRFDCHLSSLCRASHPDPPTRFAAAHHLPKMFWKMSYADTSPIDSVLERPDFTLEDLLDEDHIIQESKGENEKLLAYLTKENVLAQLIL